MALQPGFSPRLRSCSLRHPALADTSLQLVWKLAFAYRSFAIAVLRQLKHAEIYCSLRQQIAISIKGVRKVQFAIAHVNMPQIS